MQNYKGWKIKYLPIGSNYYKAIKFGVELCANSEELLCRMIDLRVENKNLNVR